MVVVVVVVVVMLSDVAIDTGHSYLGQQKPLIGSSWQPGIGGGQLCCRQMMSLLKQKQKSQGSSLGIC